MEPVEERLASFYLGQEYDLTQASLLDEQVHYDARDLTTHAVCLGMTGSGKTGLGIVLLEEATLDGVPSLVIDPKGDMTNLLLTFPELRPEDFAPWVNPDDARRKEMGLAEYAARTAEQWRQGLAGSGQGPDRIQRLKDAAEYAIFTPGSSAGRQVSVLQTLQAPALSWAEDSELLRDKIESVASALLGLIGIQADPVQSREHILLSNIFERAWQSGEDLDLAQLILRVQKPPFSQLGVFPVDTFFPEKDRMALAMQLNSLLASPSFADWIQGQPLDVGELLHSPSGKPRVSILYLAHLSEAEKQFFITLLLEQVITWMRAQPGTTSLRALLYMDEMFGHLPPSPANPPTKKPFLTLLKQARAYGLGLILATQNPVDLDYKALSNAGTWFIGRMQADRDKQRLLDGLEGVQLGEGGLRRSEFDKLISALQSRVFLLHNVHESRPVVFHSRWAMSYLRGPLTRPQVQQLVAESAAVPATQPAAGIEPAPEPGVPRPPEPRAAAAPPAAEPKPVPYSKVPPQLPSAVKQVYLPATLSFKRALDKLAHKEDAIVAREAEAGGYLLYRPALLGLATLRFPHNKSRQTHTEEMAYLVRTLEAGGGPEWAESRVRLEAQELEREPAADAYFVELGSDLGSAKELRTLEKEFEDYLYYNSVMTLQYNSHVDLYSEFGETEEAYVRRLRSAAEEAHEADAQKLKTKYERELDKLEDRLEREERELEEDKIEYDSRKQEELLSGVESVIGLFSRRRSRSLSTASRKRRMTRQAKADVDESEEVIEDLEEDIADLEEKAKDELDELAELWAERIDDVETEEVHPRRADVRIELFAVAWMPFWQIPLASGSLSVPAYEVEQA